MSTLVIFVAISILITCIFLMAQRNGVAFKLAYFLYTRTPIGRFYFLRELRNAARKYPSAHSLTEITKANDVNVLPVPYSNDNYAYVIWKIGSGKCVIVDPGHASPVITALEKYELQPSAVLITHKHWDHSYGSKKIRRLYSNVVVYGSVVDSPTGMTQSVGDGAEVVYDNLRFRVVSTPGHTLGHLAYVLMQDDGPPCLFSGDALFTGGVGRMFEGDATMYMDSLDKLCVLPLKTLLFPGHEYTINNLDFVVHIDPENDAAVKKLEWAIDRRCARLPTCPSRLEEEFTYNPYLRLEMKLSHWANAFQLEIESINNNTKLRERIFLEMRRRKDAYKYTI